MTEEIEIKGEVEGYSSEVRAFNKSIGSRGIKIEGEWHNKVASIKELEELDKKFPKGSFVKFKEKKNNRGYFDICTEIEAVEKEEAYKETIKKVPISTDSVDRQKEIMFLSCFRAAVDTTETIYRVMDCPKNRAEVEDLVIKLTEKFYNKLNDLKDVLKSKGGW